MLVPMSMLNSKNKKKVFGKFTIITVFFGIVEVIKFA